MRIILFVLVAFLVITGCKKDSPSLKLTPANIAGKWNHLSDTLTYTTAGNSSSTYNSIPVVYYQFNTDGSGTVSYGDFSYSTFNFYYALSGNKLTLDIPVNPDNHYFQLVSPEVFTISEF